MGFPENRKGFAVEQELNFSYLGLNRNLKRAPCIIINHEIPYMHCRVVPYALNSWNMYCCCIRSIINMARMIWEHIRRTKIQAEQIGCGLLMGKQNYQKRFSDTPPPPEWDGMVQHAIANFFIRGMHPFYPICILSLTNNLLAQLIKLVLFFSGMHYICSQSNSARLLATTSTSVDWTSEVNGSGGLTLGGPAILNLIVFLYIYYIYMKLGCYVSIMNI